MPSRMWDGGGSSEFCALDISRTLPPSCNTKSVPRCCQIPAGGPKSSLLDKHTLSPNPWMMMINDFNRKVKR